MNPRFSVSTCVTVERKEQQKGSKAGFAFWTDNSGCSVKTGGRKSRLNVNKLLQRLIAAVQEEILYLTLDW